MAVLAAGLASGLCGCGAPGAPMPPSLNLPDRVQDLAANRAGNQVSLTWTMPKKNTDKLLLKGTVRALVCRKEGKGPCDPAGVEMSIPPGAAGTFNETLPPALIAGPARSLSYFVELKNRNGRSAGLSNAAMVLAGEAPAAVTGLSAEVRKTGVVLRWTPDSETAAVRLRRRLSDPVCRQAQEGAARRRRPKPWSKTCWWTPVFKPATRSTKRSASARPTSTAPSAWLASPWTAKHWSWPDSSPRRCASRPWTSFRPPCPPAWPPWPPPLKTGARSRDRPELAARHRSRPGRLYRLSPRRRRAGSASRPRSRSSARPSTMPRSSPATLPLRRQRHRPGRP